MVSSGTDASTQINPFQLRLSVNGVEVPRDRRQQAGWDVVAGTDTQIEFFGPACEAIRTGHQVKVGRSCSQDIYGSAVVNVQTKPRVVLMLLDSSASRTECTSGSGCFAGGVTYWSTVQRAVGAALVAPVNDDVAFGMQFFPAKTAETLRCDVASAPEFAPVRGSQIQIMKAMLEKLPLGLSPVVGVLESVAAAPGPLADPDVNGAVVLLSDGGDNCAGVPQAAIVARLGAATQKLYDSRINTTAPNLRRMIAQGRAVLRFCGRRRRGHSPFKVTAKPQGGAEQARAAGDWEQ